MKHWHWIPLVFLAVALAAVVMAVPRLGGAPASAADPLTISLDMDTTNGGGPCAVIDSSTSHSGADPVSGPVYDVAICATGLYQGFPIGSFTFDVLYDDGLNEATEVANVAPALDDNPDANAGTTNWPDSLGALWACDNSGSGFPTGNTIAPGGDAFLACDGTAVGATFTLGDNEDHGVIAVIHFKAIAGSVIPDTLTIADSSYLAYASGQTMGECDPDSTLPMDCVGGTDNKTGAAQATATNTPTATPAPTRCPNDICPTSEPTRKAWTRTPTPTVTATPAPEEPPGPSEPPPPPPPTGGQLPQVVPPGTGSGPDGIPWASTAVWLLAAAGAVSVSLGGLYLRRARRR